MREKIFQNHELDTSYVVILQYYLPHPGRTRVISFIVVRVGDRCFSRHMMSSSIRGHSSVLCDDHTSAQNNA